MMSGNVADKHDVYSEQGDAKESSGSALRHQSSKGHSEPMDQVHLVTSSSRDGLNHAALGGKEAVILSSQQKCLNYLCNYLRQICLQEDKRIGSNMLKRSPLFFLTQIWSVEHQLCKSNLEQLMNMKYSLNQLVNICQISQGPVGEYL